jgi:hypothetical protein
LPAQAIFPASQAITQNADINSHAGALREKRWSRAPLTLRVYFASLLILALVGLALSFSPGRLFWVVLGSALTYLMLRGIRWVWIFVVVTSVLFLAVRLVASVEWINIGLSAVALVLLLAPETRRYFSRDSAIEA